MKSRGLGDVYKRQLTERLLEAQQRGLWEAPGDYREALEEQLLDGEEQA